MTGSSTLVSHVPGAATTAANPHSLSPLISADGNVVAFHSRATNLVAGQIDDGQGYDTFLYERGTGAVTLISHDYESSTTAGGGDSFASGLSADGAFVVFVSTATGLVYYEHQDRFNTNDVFLYERATGKVTLVSHRAFMPTSAASHGMNADLFSDQPSISADGSLVAYRSLGVDLVAGQSDANGGNPDVFLYHRATGGAPSSPTARASTRPRRTRPAEIRASAPTAGSWRSRRKPRTWPATRSMPMVASTCSSTAVWLTSTRRRRPTSTETAGQTCPCSGRRTARGTPVSPPAAPPPCSSAPRVTCRSRPTTTATGRSTKPCSGRRSVCGSCWAALRRRGPSPTAPPATCRCPPTTTATAGPTLPFSGRRSECGSSRGAVAASRPSRTAPPGTFPCPPTTTATAGPTSPCSGPRSACGSFMARPAAPPPRGASTVTSRFPPTTTATAKPTSPCSGVQMGAGTSARAPEEKPT